MLDNNFNCNVWLIKDIHTYSCMHVCGEVHFSQMQEN